MNRKNLFVLGFVAAVLFLGGCHNYGNVSLNSSLSYGEASAVPYSQSAYYGSYAYPAYPYYPTPYYVYPYPPYYVYDYYYPYPYFFGAFHLHHFHGGTVSPAPRRSFRSSSTSNPSPLASELPATSGRRFKK